MLPSAPDLNRLLDSLEFTRSYGFKVLDAADGACRMEVPYRPERDRPDGIVSGQVYMHAADVAFWLAIKTLVGSDEEYVTSSMATAFLGSAQRQGFVCTASVMKRGRRLIYGDAECRFGDRLLAHHTLTYVSVRAPSAVEHRPADVVS